MKKTNQLTPPPPPTEKKVCVLFVKQREVGETKHPQLAFPLVNKANIANLHVAPIMSKQNHQPTQACPCNLWVALGYPQFFFCNTGRPPLWGPCVHERTKTRAHLHVSPSMRYSRALLCMHEKPGCVGQLATSSLILATSSAAKACLGLPLRVSPCRPFFTLSSLVAPTPKRARISVLERLSVMYMRMVASCDSGVSAAYCSRMEPNSASVLSSFS